MSGVLHTRTHRDTSLAGLTPHATREGTGSDRRESVRMTRPSHRPVLHRSVLDVIYLVATLALFAVVALIARGVERL